jgi:hypothetical protein
MVTCPFCHQEALRIITAITQAEVIKNILRHLKLAADPPPITPTRSRQETFDWVASALPWCLASGVTGGQRRYVSRVDDTAERVKSFPPALRFTLPSPPFPRHSS